MLELSFVLAWGSLLGAACANHPLVMALGLTLASLFSSIILGMLFSSWATVAIALIFLGGMMVIFIYFTSLVPNEKLVSRSHNLPLFLIMLVAVTFMATKWSSKSFLMALFNFEELNSSLTYFLVTYLLFILLLVVEMSRSFKGALELSSF